MFARDRSAAFEKNMESAIQWFPRLHAALGVSTPEAPAVARLYTLVAGMPASTKSQLTVQGLHALEFQVSRVPGQADFKTVVCAALHETAESAVALKSGVTVERIGEARHPGPSAWRALLYSGAADAPAAVPPVPQPAASPWARFGRASIQAQAAASAAAFAVAAPTAASAAAFAVAVPGPLPAARRLRTCSNERRPLRRSRRPNVLLYERGPPSSRPAHLRVQCDEEREEMHMRGCANVPTVVCLQNGRPPV
jgi:hypothetical protein